MPALAAPLYNIEQVVYLRESAAIGFLESFVIGGVTRCGSFWVYSVAEQAPPARRVTFGDHRDQFTDPNCRRPSMREDELIDLCAALSLVELKLRQQLDTVVRMRAAKCPAYDGSNFDMLNDPFE